MMHQSSRKIYPIIILALLTFIVGCAESGSQFDTSYSPIGGSGTDGLAGWNAEQVTVRHYHDRQSFRMRPDGSRLASEPAPIRQGERIKLHYMLNNDGSAVGDAVAVRSYGSDGSTILSESRFDLARTNGRWSQQQHQLTVDDRAYYVDVVYESTSDTPIYLDDIAIFREMKYNPMWSMVKPLSEGDTLYVYTRDPRAHNRFFAIQTMQGVAARVDRPRVWVDMGDNTYVDYLSQKHNIEFDWSMADDFEAMVTELKPYTSGQYVLYDMQDLPSITAAATMAGLLDAVAVDTQLESTIQDLGFTKALDVRGKDCLWVFENYREQINHDLVTVHTNDMDFHGSAYHLKDWPAATQSLVWWYDDEDITREVLGSMNPVSPVYGWLSPTTGHDEGLAIWLHSEAGLFQIPSDWGTNFTVHAGMGPTLADENFEQIVPRERVEVEQDVHYVTFILSDMDNVLTQIGTDSFYSEELFYANPHRGKFPMTWGMAPSLVELAPHSVRMWYDGATDNDIFIAYCGLGYSYNQHSPYLQTHAKRLGEFMDRADLSVLLVIDYLNPYIELDEDYYEATKWFTGLDQVDGMYYLEYRNYAPHDGMILWFDDKPVVTARYDYRDNQFYPVVIPTARELADAINGLPRDPSAADGYTMITVEAWSKGVTEVYEAIQLLDDHVRVVDGEQFIQLIKENVER